MSKGVGVDAAAARTVSDALSEFKLPDVPEASPADCMHNPQLPEVGHWAQRADSHPSDDGRRSGPA